MDAATIISSIENVINLAAKAASTGASVYGYAEAIWNTIGGKEPTETDLAALETQVDAMHAEIQAPLPAAQPGDPDFGA